MSEDLRQPGDLLERQQVLTAEKFEIAPENLPRHAVRAAKVAAVGDRDPQIAKRAAETVEGHCALVTRNRGPRHPERSEGSQVAYREILRRRSLP